MNTSRLAILILLLVGGLGVFFVLNGGEEQLPPSVTPTGSTETTEEVSPPMQVREVVRSDEQRRERIDDPEARSGRNYGQGVRGTVVDPSNRPVAGAKVYLVEGSTGNVFRRIQALQDGVVFPPTASTETDDQGMFELGLSQVIPNTTFEVRIISDAYSDHGIPNLTIQKDDWYDAGLVRLQQGTVVYGRITVAGEGIGVPNATVYLEKVGELMQVTPTPGREEGLKVLADENGYFEVRNAPSGSVDISAAAPYFSRVYRREVNLEPMVANEVSFTLSRGLAIRGLVTDPRGAPVRGAKVMASSLLPDQPQTAEARTGGDGSFEFLSLVEAPFKLSVLAQGYQRRDEQPVQAGAEDVRLVLDEQGAARVKVVGRNGRLMRSYRLAIKSHFARQDMIGNVANQAPRDINGGDLQDGYATVQGLNPGNYVFQVDHRDYAKTFSQPFAVGPGIPLPAVEVRMTQGGRITGTVTDRDGAPISGVLVQTQANGMVKNPFTERLFPNIPKKISETSVRTDAQGRYRLASLGKGAYQIEFSHPEYSDEVLKDLVVIDGQDTQAAQVRLIMGTLVSGRTTLNGVPSGQIKVSIQMTAEEGKATPRSFFVEAVSNNAGEYTVAKRLPPGTYQVQASRQAAGPFDMIIDYQNTRRTISVGRGQQTIAIDIDLPSR